MTEALLNFLQSEAVNKSFIAKELYGSSTKANVSKLHSKINGTQGRKFNEDELTKLEEIRKEFIKKLI